VDAQKLPQKSLKTVDSPTRPAATRSWRRAAAAIVEELFPSTDPCEWNALLDLRTALLMGNDWSETLDLFLAARVRLEAANYLPFYRLRRLLAGSLRLEVYRLGGSSSVAPLANILSRPHPSLEHIKKTLDREEFEFGNCPQVSALRLVLRETETPGESSAATEFCGAIPTLADSSFES
jgi:hypothetical protein